MDDVNEPTSVARSRRYARSARCAVAGIAMAALAGCGDIGANEAAIIDGESIGESELQETTAQLNSISTEAVSPSSVLSELTRTPFLDEVMDGTPEALTDQDITELLAENGLGDPSDLTVDVARTRQYLVVLQDPEVVADPEMAEALNQLQTIQAADIAAIVDEINPRYGSFDAGSANVISSDPEWIEPAG
ncbi:MAG: hypothetical protein WBG57_07210 [Ornithinimicrobium sp.]